MSLKEELERKLSGGKFRLLNEKMYKNKGLTREESLKYHQYYAEQIKKWPQNPKKLIVEHIQNTVPEAKIADLGCGDAELASIFPNVVSFDKYPVNSSIIKAGLEEVPVEDKTFGVAVNSLSLMAGYISKVVKEVHRILQVGGLWYVAEVRSRIRNIKSLIDGVEKFGFKLKEVDTKNTHFCILIFTKESESGIEGKLPEIKLKPCLYKKR